MSGKTEMSWNLSHAFEYRRMKGTLDDYWEAPSEGPLHAEWQDKPHRLLYDLIGEIVRLNALLPKEQPHE